MNPNIGEIGKATQFTSDNQPDPSLVGRKPGKTFKQILDALLEMVVKDEGVKSAKEIIDMYPDGNVTYKQAMAVRMVAKAILDPESKSAERIMNRVDGKPEETINQRLQVTEIEIRETVILKKPTEEPTEGE